MMLAWIQAIFQHRRQRTISIVIFVLVCASLLSLYHGHPDLAYYNDYYTYHSKQFMQHADVYLNNAHPISDPSQPLREHPPSSIGFDPDKGQQKSFLHLLVPATSSNENLCKTLLTITSTGYPSPVFINWGAEEKEDPYAQHLAKVGGLLQYLQSIASTTRPDDLVLIVDGYDVWFQLRPDVMISRYYDVINAQNKRLADDLGEFTMKHYGIEQSVLLSSDKICWPPDPRRPACWAVPESTLPKYAFGPDTDQGKFGDHNRPRWLNSGTIMGPLADVTKFLQATVNTIKTSQSDILSDQFHMSNIFGLQSVGRRQISGQIAGMQREREVRVLDDKIGHSRFENVTLDVPHLEPAQAFEYHLAVDHESQLFQTNTYYWKYLDWFFHDGTTHVGSLSDHAAINDNITDEHRLHFELPKDILASPPPFANIGDNSVRPKLKGGDPSREPRLTGVERPLELSWRDVELGTNIASPYIFPLIHFTPPKEWLLTWWHDMWFFSYGEAIIKNAPPVQSVPILRTEDGKEWWTWAPNLDSGAVEPQQGGGYDDKGGWHGWDELCKAHERVVFLNELAPVPP